MQYNLPKKINSESDLKHYENYLYKDTTVKTEILNLSTMEEYLKNKIGICVSVQCLNYNKTGVILEVGKDYLIICRSNNNTLIPFCNIKSIILPQGNRTHRHHGNLLP